MKTLSNEHFMLIRKLFADYGIKSITMDDICAKLGISKKTLYNEYTDKSELVTVVFRNNFYDFKSELLSATKNSHDAIVETCLLFKLINEKQKSLSLSSLYDLRKYYFSLFNEITGFLNHLILETVSGTIKRGILENNFRENIVPDKIAAIVAFIFDSKFMQPLYNSAPNSISLSDYDLIEYHFNCICTRQGLELWEQNKIEFCHSFL